MHSIRKFALIVILLCLFGSINVLSAQSLKPNTNSNSKVQEKGDPYYKVTNSPLLPAKQGTYTSRPLANKTLTNPVSRHPSTRTTTNPLIPKSKGAPSTPNSNLLPNNTSPNRQPTGNRNTQFALPSNTDDVALENPTRTKPKVPPSTQFSTNQQNSIQQPGASTPLLKKEFDPIEPESIVSNSSLQSKPIELSKSIPPQLFEPGQTLALVGGKPIFAADLMLEANQLIERFMAAAPDEIKLKQRKAILPKLVNKYVESKLIYVDIERGLPAEADVDGMFESLGDHFDREMLPRILEKNKMKSAQEFDIQLRAQTVSLRQFRQKWIEDEFVKFFLKDKIKMDPEVTHQEMLDYYWAHQSDYELQPRARWEQLFVSFSRIPDRTKAKREISEMGNEVVYGASFAAVAKKRSHDFKAKDGGDQGWVNQGSLASEKLDKAVFELPMQRLSDVIETPLGFHIIRIKERHPGGRKPFLEAQSEIQEMLKEKKREQSLKDHIAKLRREIPVEVFLVDPEAEKAESSTRQAANPKLFK